jgi:hypothetical protein
MVCVTLVTSTSCRNLERPRRMLSYARTNIGTWSNPRTYERSVLRTAAASTDRLQLCVLQGYRESGQSVGNEWRQGLTMSGCEASPINTIRLESSDQFSISGQSRYLCQERESIFSNILVSLCRVCETSPYGICENHT